LAGSKIIFKHPLQDRVFIQCSGVGKSGYVLIVDGFDLKSRFLYFFDYTKCLINENPFVLKLSIVPELGIKKYISSRSCDFTESIGAEKRVYFVGKTNKEVVMVKPEGNPPEISILSYDEEAKLILFHYQEMASLINLQDNTLLYHHSTGFVSGGVVLYDVRTKSRLVYVIVNDTCLKMIEINEKGELNESMRDMSDACKDMWKLSGVFRLEHRGLTDEAHVVVYGRDCALLFKIGETKPILSILKVKCNYEDAKGLISRKIEEIANIPKPVLDWRDF